MNECMCVSEVGCGRELFSYVCMSVPLCPCHSSIIILQGELKINKIQLFGFSKGEVCFHAVVFKCTFIRESSGSKNIFTKLCFLFQCECEVILTNYQKFDHFSWVYSSLHQHLFLSFFFIHGTSHYKKYFPCTGSFIHYC